MKKLIEKYKKIIQKNYAAGAVHFYGSERGGAIPKNDSELNAAFANILGGIQSGQLGSSGALLKLEELKAFYNDKTEPYGNWWYWEIGIPRSLNQIFTLIYDSASKKLLDEYMSAERRFCGSIKMTGANRLWESEIFAVRGILSGREDEVSAAIDGIKSLFVYSDGGDGFYRDGSFIQHECIAYNGGYGLSMLSGLADMIRLFDISENIVYEWIEKSFLPFMYKGVFMDMVRGREISRYYSTAEYAYKKAEYFIKELGGANAAEDGFYYFERMDRAVYKKSGFAAGLSMQSGKTAAYESINNENMTAWHAGDGMLYLYTDPTRFSGSFFPCADMEAMPGTTIIRGEYPEPNKPCGESFSGGAKTDCGGLCAMQLAPRGTRLKAKKAWFFLDGCIVCLGADITRGAETVIENIILEDESTVEISDGRVYVKRSAEDYGLTVLCSDMEIKRERRKGSWENISSVSDGRQYSAEFLTMYKKHDVRSTYEYILIPGERENADGAADIEIIENTNFVQSVKYRREIYSVIWEKDKVKITGGE